jgi:transcriptional regulator with XRE-family HTH domain
MELTAAEAMTLRLKRAGIEQRAICEELDMLPPTLSRYLSGALTMPEDFPSRFQGAFERAVAKKAAAVRAEADERARKMIESASGVPA